MPAGSCSLWSFLCLLICRVKELFFSFILLFSFFPVFLPLPPPAFLLPSRQTDFILTGPQPNSFSVCQGGRGSGECVEGGLPPPALQENTVRPSSLLLPDKPGAEQGQRPAPGGGDTPQQVRRSASLSTCAALGLGDGTSPHALSPVRLRVHVAGGGGRTEGKELRPVSRTRC